MGKQIILPFESGQVTIPDGIKIVNLPCEAGEVSDDDHTFSELYSHRSTLFLALLSQLKVGWYSTKHSDGSEWEGWFIAGITLPQGSITYHLPNSFLELAGLYLTKLEFAPEWDGHNSKDVLDRLRDWMLSGAYPCNES